MYRLVQLSGRFAGWGYGGSIRSAFLEAYPLLCYISQMSKKDLGDVQFAGKVKTQTFKQYQLERLIKDGKVIPASKLAEAKKQELKRIRDFEAAAVDEERHSRTASPPPKDKIANQPLTRERLKE
jgi:hypothetical protein